MTLILVVMMNGNSEEFFFEDIYENILKFADGKTLVSARAVNTLWRTIVTRLDKNYGIWRLCCYEEKIPAVVIYHIIVRLFPQHWIFKNYHSKICWRTIYQHWQEEFELSKCSYLIIEAILFSSISKFISCFNITGRWMIIGVYGCIYIFLNKNQTFPQLYKSKTIPGAVKHVTPLFNKAEHQMNSLEDSSSYGCDAILLRIEFIGAYGMERNIHMIYNPFSDSLEAVTVDQSNFKIFYSKDKTIPIIYFRTDKEDYYCNLDSVDKFFKDKFHLNMDNFILEFRFLQEKVEDRTLYSCLNVITNPKVTNIITYRNNKHMSYKVKLCVTAVRFYINWLFLGTKTGSVEVYRFNHLYDDVKTEITHERSIKVSENSIEGVEIVISKCRLTIVCHTIKNVFYILFN